MDAEYMTKICELCSGIIHDGDEVVASMVSVFVQIPSRVMYAVEKPTDCLNVVHKRCYVSSKDDDHENTQIIE